MHVRDLVIRLFVESTDLLNNLKIYQGIYIIFSSFSLSVNLAVQLVSS